ncbi:farnesyltranstransferase [Hygrophoropsis aurantiaca]|uniref:Farnesyltranstransferase n=1 Tax=Hygrophoropsis aurantiaca TaxID=72124 RepID=A0ACB8A984_9AGAM|nr:farnesyltranstransferase [Hygrophoropsis aurantiaca]
MSLPLYSNLSSVLSSPTSSDDVLLEPYTYTTATPGKEIRSAMIAAFNAWLCVPPATVSHIADVVRMLHSASLMVDDIEDASLLRRGRPVAHRIYGVAQTINAANFVYFLAFRRLTALAPPELLDDITDELLRLHRGQGEEILWRDTLRCPQEEQYLRMVNNKTGGLFRIAVKLMQASATSGTENDYIPLVNLFGVLFQIRDDYMNLQSTEYTKHKGFAEDLTEGKFSFPIVHAVLADQSNREILNILQKRPSTPTLKHHAIAYLRNHTRSLAYTRQVLRVLDKQVGAACFWFLGGWALGCFQYRAGRCFHAVGAAPACIVLAVLGFQYAGVVLRPVLGRWIALGWV